MSERTITCPNCGRHYWDISNKVSITETGVCLTCRAEDIDRWDAEGGK